MIGAGKMGALAARRLKAEGAADIVVLNRSHKRAQDVASELGEIARVAEMPGLVDALRTADVVVTSTGASHFVLTPGNVAEAMLARPERPLFIVDIAVPRDVDPEVGAHPRRRRGRRRCAQGRRRRHAREAARGDPAGRSRSSPSTSSASSSGTSRASRSR